MPSRRHFIVAGVSAAVVAALPTPAPESYWCSCKLVEYMMQREGYYAASHIIVNGQRTRLSFPLHCWHTQLHRKSRMWLLIEIAKHRPLMVAEKAELQRCFIRVARNEFS
jgi:hypothetical protein